GWTQEPGHHKALLRARSVRYTEATHAWFAGNGLETGFPCNHGSVGVGQCSAPIFFCLSQIMSLHRIRYHSADWCSPQPQPLDHSGERNKSEFLSINRENACRPGILRSRVPVSYI